MIEELNKKKPMSNWVPVEQVVLTTNLMFNIWKV